MSRYHLSLNETLNVVGGDGLITSSEVVALAELHTDQPEVLAATLRALADRLDPPKRVVRRGDDLNVTRGDMVVRSTNVSPFTTKS